MLLPFAVLFLPFLFDLAKPVSGYLLLAITLASLLRGEKKVASAFAFLLSGALGLVLLSKPLVGEPLFPLLSGLFAVPALLFSLGTAKPVQSAGSRAVRLDLKIVFASVVLGALSSLLPAMTPVLLVSILLFFTSLNVGRLNSWFGGAAGREAEREIEEDGRIMLFLQSSSAALVSKTFFDFVAFASIGKARSGAVAFASQELRSPENLALALAAGLAALFVAIAVMLLLCKRLSAGALPGLAGRHVGLGVFAFILASCFLTGGSLALLALAVSASVGIAIGLLGVNKTTALGCLLLPSLAFFFTPGLF